MSAEDERRAGDLAEEVAALACASGQRVAVAESLTAGRLACALGAASDASTWFRGSVVAYAPEVKFDVLGVDPGPVNTASCAHQMAAGVRRLLGADVAAAVTGVGGPGPDEGVPAGTVFLAVAGPDGEIEVEELFLPGDSDEVVAATVSVALGALARALEAAPSCRPQDAGTR
ncbi:MAG: CinA family protein [Marmoricola sp.]